MKFFFIKKNKTYRLFILIVLLLGAMHAVHAQNTTEHTYFKIKTSDGNVYFGSIVSETSEFLVFNATEIGRVTLRKADIESKEQIEDNRIYQGKVFPNRLLSVNYFFTQNALALKKGEAYYQNIYLFFNQVTVGVSDRFSLGIGTVPFSGFGNDGVPVWVTPKLTFPLKNKKISLGVGAFVLGALGNDEGIYGLTYGNITLGDEHANVSAGIGYTYRKKRSNNPVFSLSGMFKGKRNTYLMMDSFAFKTYNKYEALIIFGGRTHMRKSIIDYGVLIPIMNDAELNFGLGIVPWGGLIVPL